MALSHVKFGTAFQSVEGLVSEGYIRFRVVVPVEMLRRDLEAGEDPETWMQAFNDNAVAIESAARRIYQASNCTVIILHLLER